MTGQWIWRETRHKCELPELNDFYKAPPGIDVGDRWRCDTCQAVYTVERRAQHNENWLAFKCTTPPDPGRSYF